MNVVKEESIELDDTDKRLLHHFYNPAVLYATLHVLPIHLCLSVSPVRARNSIFREKVKGQGQRASKTTQKLASCLLTVADQVQEAQAPTGN